MVTNLCKLGKVDDAVLSLLDANIAAANKAGAMDHVSVMSRVRVLLASEISYSQHEIDLCEMIRSAHEGSSNWTS